MTLGVLCHGLRNSLARVHGHAQRTDEGLDEPGMGGDDALVSRIFPANFVDAFEN
jgi:hypothetical protein